MLVLHLITFRFKIRKAFFFFFSKLKSLKQCYSYYNPFKDNVDQSMKYASDMKKQYTSSVSTVSVFNKYHFADTLCVASEHKREYYFNRKFYM